MPEKHVSPLDLDDNALPPLPEIGAEQIDEPWFLRPDDEDSLEPTAMPIPRADRRALFDPPEWRAAQGMLAAELAQVCLRFGMLDERLAAMGQGARQRLAIREVADLGWWTGDRIGVDRLALWLTLRAGMAGEDAPALARAGWAVRRLTTGQGPMGQGSGSGEWQAAIAGVLGRERASAAEEVAEAMDRLDGLHPVVEAAALFHAWRIAVTGPSAAIEAAVLAARHAARIGRGQALFLPLSLAGISGLTASGPAERRLSLWLTGAEQATLSALAELDRLRAWEARAVEATVDLSGRTPAALVSALATWPALSAPMAEELTGASRAAIQRNLDLFAERGLVREITGQSRYRVWVVDRAFP